MTNSNSSNVIPIIPTELQLPLIIGGGTFFLLCSVLLLFCLCRKQRHSGTEVTPRNELRQSLLSSPIKHSGWLHKTGPKSRIKESWKRRYFVLCGRSTLSYLKDTLYYFDSEEAAHQFFSTENTGKKKNNKKKNKESIRNKPKEKGCINLIDVNSLRFSSRTDLPNGGRGLEIHTSSRIWLISCDENDDGGYNSFDEWVRMISEAANKRPRRTSTSQDEVSGKKKRMSRRPSRSGRSRSNSRRHSRTSFADEIDGASSTEGKRNSNSFVDVESQVPDNNKKEEKALKSLLPDVDLPSSKTPDSINIGDDSPQQGRKKARKSIFFGIATAITGLVGKNDDFKHSSRDTEEDPDDQSFSFFLTSGWVYKRGKLNKSYKKRWFQHQNGILQYYLSETSTKLKGELIVKMASIVIENELEFSINVPGRSLHCKCDTREEAAKWIKCLQKK